MIDRRSGVLFHAAILLLAKLPCPPYRGVVTALEAFELTTKGGATDFARAITACETLGPYCLIGGLAVNCYVEPIYTLDADIVVVNANLEELLRYLQGDGFVIEVHTNSLNAKRPASELRIQFTTDPRYQDFLSRAEEHEVFGLSVRVARLEDVARDELWAYGDPQRCRSKRKKDELDLIRLAEKYPTLERLYPAELMAQLG
jgi:hypothetical protein